VLILLSVLRSNFSGLSRKMNRNEQWKPAVWRKYLAPTIGILLVSVACLDVTKAVAGTGFETPPILQARDLAPATLLNGNGFHVDSQVPTDGLTANFTIHTDLGTIQAHGIEMLRIRIAEVPAMIELNQISKTKVFAQSLATNTVRPVAAAGMMIMNPVETVKGLPGGVARFFGRVGLAGKRLKEAATEPEGASVSERTGEVAARAGQTTRDVFGYEQERRELAKKLGVDPYTTNPILSSQLDDIALTAFRAHVGVTTAMAVFIPGSIAITSTRIVSTWVWDTPRADLIVMNEEKLRRLLVPETEIKAFSKNQSFPLSVQTAFVEDLMQLEGLRGLVGVVKLANTLQSEDQARFLTDSVDFLARYHRTQSPLVEIIARRTAFGRDQAGVLVVPAEVDYVSWTPRIAAFANRPDLASSKRSLWLSGRMSPLAKSHVQTLGWVVIENASL
jgi:hypothetical protein